MTFRQVNENILNRNMNHAQQYMDYWAHKLDPLTYDDYMIQVTSGDHEKVYRKIFGKQFDRYPSLREYLQNLGIAAFV